MSRSNEKKGRLQQKQAEIFTLYYKTFHLPQTPKQRHVVFCITTWKVVQMHSLSSSSHYKMNSFVDVKIMQQNHVISQRSYLCNSILFYFLSCPVLLCPLHRSYSLSNGTFTPGTRQIFAVLYSHKFDH